MLLWSIQHQCTYEKMEQTGVLRADKNFIATDWFEDSYLWMAEQMKKRIGEPPEGVIFPVWAWYQWEGMRKRLDMRVHGRNWGEKGTPIVLLTIEVPDNLVLLSDFSHGCLGTKMWMYFTFKRTADIENIFPAFLFFLFRIHC